MQELETPIPGSITARIFQLNSDCIRLCDELRQCFERERRAVIHFKIDDVMETNATKEALIRYLTARKNQLRECVREQFGLSDTAELESKLEGEVRLRWIDARKQWLKTWEETKQACLTNQHFLKHSLKNMTLIADHFKRQFGERTTYTAQGKRLETGTSGKVVEVRY